MTPSARGSVGRIQALWRYPVKSMQGEELHEAALGPDGIVGDRTYALRDAEGGGIVSAKYPRKWAALAHCRAAFVAPPREGAPLPAVRITLPDGSQVRSDAPQVDALLSELLGRPVTLTQTAEAGLLRETDRTPLVGGPPTITQEPLGLAAPGTFFDVAPLHLLSTSVLERLRSLQPGSDFAAERFRPNLVVAPLVAGQGLAEEEWIGAAIRLGDAEVEIIDPTPRCVVITLARDALPHDPQMLRTVVQHTAVVSATLAPGARFPGVVGVYGRIRTAALVRVGDVVLRSTHRRNGNASVA